jgi:hypothetical protein
MPVRLSQYFTPSTGQRAYTFVDVLNSINNQIDELQDPTVADAAAIILTPATPDTDPLGITDTVSVTTVSQTLWDAGSTYIQGAWQ